MLTARNIREFGVFLLALGLSAAIAIYMVQSREDLRVRDDDFAMKREVSRWERMGGKSLILFNDISNWFSSLWHGQKLAYTVGVFAIAGFLTCRWYAATLEESDAQKDQRSSDDKPA